MTTATTELRTLKHEAMQVLLQKIIDRKDEHESTLATYATAYANLANSEPHPEKPVQVPRSIR